MIDITCYLSIYMYIRLHKVFSLWCEFFRQMIQISAALKQGNIYIEYGRFYRQFNNILIYRVAGQVLLKDCTIVIMNIKLKQLKYDKNYNWG